VAGGSGSTSPDEVLERIGPRGDGELVSEAKFPTSGSLQGISGILAQMGPSGIRAQMGPKLRSGTFNKGSIGLVTMSVLGTPVDLEKVWWRLAETRCLPSGRR
jgi:hypothetical protein